MRKTTLLLSALVPVSSFWVPKGFLLRPCSNAAGLGGPAVIRQRFQIARISRSAPPSSSAAVIHHHSLLRMQPPPPPPHGAAPSLLSLGPPLLTAAAASITSTKLLRLVQLPLPLLYSLLAGLSTCLGAAVVFLVAPPVGAAATTANNNNNSNNTTGGSSRGGSSSSSSSSAMMAFALSLAGSVMVTVSAVSLLPEAFSSESGGASSWEGSLLSLALGCGLCGVLSQMAFPEPDEVLGFYDKHNNMRQKEEHDDTSATTILTSEATNPAESATAAAAAEEEEESRRRAWRLAVLLFVSLLCHNFPEGCAVAASTSVNPRLGVSTSLAIALHNVPEGVAIAVPALRARPDRPGMAFGLASLSGLAEPVGAAVTLALIQQQQGGGGTGRIPSLNNNDILAFVAGIMMTVAIRELFPEAWRHSKKDAPAALVAGTATGIVVMLATEMFLQV